MLEDEDENKEKQNRISRLNKVKQAKIIEMKSWYTRYQKKKGK
jgi:hypothetical protein